MMTSGDKIRYRFATKVACFLAFVAVLAGLTGTIGTPTVRAAESRQRIIFVQGIGSSYSREAIRRGEDGPFETMKTKLSQDYGYDSSDFIDFSYRMGSYNSSEFDIGPLDYDCQTTGQSLDQSSANLRDLLRNAKNRFPNDKLVLVAHSLGGQVITRAVEAGYSDPWRQSVAAIVTMNSPLYGISTGDLSIEARTIVHHRQPCKYVLTDSEASKDLDTDIRDYESIGVESRVAKRLEKSLGFSFANNVRIGTFGLSQDCVFNHRQCDPFPTTKNRNWTQVYGIGASRMYYDKWPCLSWSFKEIVGIAGCLLSFHGRLTTQPTREILDTIGQQTRPRLPAIGREPQSLPPIGREPTGGQPGQPPVSIPVEPPQFSGLSATNGGTVDVAAGGRVNVKVSATYRGGAGNIPCGQINLGVVGDASASFRADEGARGAWEQHGWRSTNRVAASDCINGIKPNQQVEWLVQLAVPPEQQPGTYPVGRFSPVYDGSAKGWSTSQITLSVRVSYGRPVFSNLEAFASNKVTVTAGDRVGVEVIGTYDGAAAWIPCGQLNLGVVGDQDARFRADSGAPGAWEQHGWRSPNRVAAKGCIDGVGYGQKATWGIELDVPPQTPVGEHLIGTFSPVYDGYDREGWAKAKIPIYINVVERRPVFDSLQAYSSNNVEVAPGDDVTIVVAGRYRGGAGNIPCGELNLGVVGDGLASFRDDADLPGTTWEQHGWRSPNRVAAAGCNGEVRSDQEVQWHVKLYVPPDTPSGTYLVGTFAPVQDGQWGNWAASQIALSVTVPGLDIDNLEAFSSSSVTVTAGDRVGIVVAATYMGGRGTVPCGLFNLGVVDDLDAAFRDDAEAPGAWEQHGWRSANRVAAAGCTGDAVSGQKMQWNVNLYVPPDTPPGTYPVGRFSPVFDGTNGAWSGNTIDLSVVVTAAAERPDNGRPRFGDLTTSASNEVAIAPGDRATVVVTGMYDGGKGAIPCEKLHLGVVNDAEASFWDGGGEGSPWLSANRVAPQGCVGEVPEGWQVQWSIPLYVPPETQPGTYLVGNFSPVYDDIDNGWSESQISLFVAVTAPTPDEPAVSASTPEPSVPVTPDARDQPTDAAAATEPTAAPPTEDVGTPEPAVTEPPTSEQTPTEPVGETPTTVATEPTAEHAQTSASLPAEYAGTWEGDAIQVDPAAEFPLTITFIGGDLNELVATVAYPSDGCAGELRLDRVDPSSIQLTESITDGAEICIDGGAMTLTMNPDGTMDFSWSAPDGTTTAGATLVPVDGGADATVESTGEPTTAATSEPTETLTETVVATETVAIDPVDGGDVAEATPLTEQAADALPPEFTGVWEGQGVQTNPDVEWPVTITFTGGGVGEVVASVAYPSYECTGELTLEAVEADTITLTEDITVGECSDGGTIVLSLLSDGAIAFSWSSVDGSSTATATLANITASTDSADEPTTEPAVETIAPLPTETVGDDGGGVPPDDIATAEPTADGGVVSSGGGEPTAEGEGGPDEVADLLPTEADVPDGLTLIADEERTLDELSTLFSAAPVEVTASLEGWGWRANAYREFGIDGEPDDPAATTSLTVSVHQFGDEGGASQALAFFLTDATAVFGIDEVPVGPEAGAEPLGAEARALAGPANGANLVVLYVRTGAFVIRAGGTSSTGNPMADVEAMVRSILARAEQPADVASDGTEPTAEVVAIDEEPEGADEGTNTIASIGGSEGEDATEEPAAPDEPQPTKPTIGSSGGGSSDVAAADRASQAAVVLSRLEAARDFDGLYDLKHPDAQALIPREAVVGWYEADLATRDAGRGRADRHGRRLRRVDVGGVRRHLPEHGRDRHHAPLLRRERGTDGHFPHHPPRRGQRRVALVLRPDREFRQRPY